MTESTTVALASDSQATAELLAGELASWQELASWLPEDLDASAKASGALVRRRGIRCAADLLRMVFAYAVCDWSLRLAGKCTVCMGAWLTTIGLAELSDVAILKRLQGCQRWLGQLVAQLLQQRRAWLAHSQGVCLRIVDASRVADSQQRLWCVHASFDLGQGCLAGVEVSDAHSGESLVRFPGQPGEIYLADRGYAHPKGLGGQLVSGALLAVRCHWQNLALEQDDGRPLDVLGWLRSSQSSSFSQPDERPAWLNTPSGRPAAGSPKGAREGQQARPYAQPGQPVCLRLHPGPDQSARRQLAGPAGAGPVPAEMASGTAVQALQEYLPTG